MRRHPVGKVEIDLVDIAPAPALGRVIAFDDRMRCFVEVLGCMAIWGIVAAADMAAGATDAQMDPPASGLEAFLATVGAGRHVGDRMVMRTRVGHRRSLGFSDAPSTRYGGLVR